jgi:hypothetical protein
MQNYSKYIYESNQTKNWSLRQRYRQRLRKKILLNISLIILFVLKSINQIKICSEANNIQII